MKTVNVNHLNIFECFRNTFTGWDGVMWGQQMNKYIRVIEFENGYSASIVSHDGSYGGKEGLFEIAVLHDGEIVYDTPVTNDAIGWLDFAGVATILKDIEELPPRN
jgi:hypothetical protein